MDFLDKHITFKRVLLVSLIVIMINLIILDYKEIIAPTLNRSNILGVSQQSCPKACIAKIQEAVGGSASIAKIREHFVPIGTGTSTATEWEDVPGLQVIVDTASYGRIKQAFFEASTHTVNSNQTVYVRLFNVTDKHPVWFSELTFNDSINPGSQTSSQITLDAGNKAYKVQMKTQLRYTATLDNARLRIVSH